MPTFSSIEKLEKAVPKLYINSTGILAMKRILWAIHKVYDYLNYCPLLPPLVSVLLVYLNEEEVFQLCCKIIEHSNNHFLVTKSLFKEFIGDIVKIVKREASVLEKFDTELEKIITDMIRKLFISYFRISCLLRIILIYLVEGKSILAKIIASAFISLCSNTLPKSMSLKEALQAFSFSLPSCDDILKQSFRIQFSMDEEIDLRFPGNHRSTFVSCSGLVSESHMQEIFSHLDPNYHSFTPKAVYTSNIPSLTNLLSAASVYPQSTSMVILLLTNNYELCGFFTDCALYAQKVPFGSERCMVFMLEPEVKFFSANKKGTIHVTDKFIKIGTEKPAVWIENKTMSFASYKSKDFGNESLIGAEVIVNVCELIVFI